MFINAGLFDTFRCTFEIEHNGQKSVKTIEAPMVVIQQQILSVAQQLSRLPGNGRVKVSRKVPIYNNFENRWIELENSIVFTK